MSTFIINGKRFETEGNADSISSANGEFIINGREIDISEFASAPVINIVVEGPVTSVSTQSGDVTVNGDVGTVKSTSGDIDIDGDVTGDVSTVSGDVKVSGSISGKVKTVSGDIRSKR